MTTPIPAALPPTSVSSLTAPTGPAAPKDQMGKDTFLALLVAQLRYQNPMEPADSQAFLAQTAQFTMVEKLDQVSQQNAELLAVTELLSASGLVGKSVSWTDDQDVARSGVVSATRLTADGPVLRVGTEDVPLSKLQEVTAGVTSPQTPAA